METGGSAKGKIYYDHLGKWRVTEHRGSGRPEYYGPVRYTEDVRGAIYFCLSSSKGVLCNDAYLYYAIDTQNKKALLIDVVVGELKGQKITEGLIRLLKERAANYGVTQVSYLRKGYHTKELSPIR